MERIEKQEEQSKVVKMVDNVMSAIDNCIPSVWSKSQVAAMLNLYLELYK